MLRDRIDDCPDCVFCDPKQYDFNLGNPTCKTLGPSVLLIVQPRTSQHVAASILLARDTDTPLSIRGGGHSYACNSIKANSIHVDMRSMNEKQVIDNIIDVSPYPGEERLLEFGTGVTFNDLFEIYDRETSSFVHGEGYSVGVGGYYLHGGSNLSGLTKRYGYGNETLRAMELVTADGKILRFQESRTRRLPEIPGEPLAYDRDPVRVYDESGQMLDPSMYEEHWIGTTKY